MDIKQSGGSAAAAKALNGKDPWGCSGAWNRWPSARGSSCSAASWQWTRPADHATTSGAARLSSPVRSAGRRTACAPGTGQGGATSGNGALLFFQRVNRRGGRLELGGDVEVHGDQIFHGIRTQDLSPSTTTSSGSTWQPGLAAPSSGAATIRRSTDSRPSAGPPRRG